MGMLTIMTGEGIVPRMCRGLKASLLREDCSKASFPTKLWVECQPAYHIPFLNESPKLSTNNPLFDFHPRGIEGGILECLKYRPEFKTRGKCPNCGGSQPSARYMRMCLGVEICHSTPRSTWLKTK